MADDRSPVDARRDRAARVEGERMVVTWVGHATVLIQTQGLNILTDPVWSGPGRAARLRAAARRRARHRASTICRKIDLVLVSHNHYDHLDQATLEAAVAARPAADRHQPRQRQRHRRRPAPRRLALDWAAARRGDGLATSDIAAIPTLVPGDRA